MYSTLQDILFALIDIFSKSRYKFTNAMLLTTTQEYGSPSLIAAINGRPDCLRELIRLGANLNMRTKVQNSMIYN